MTTSDRKWVYAFENGDGKNKMLLGGKGANLCEMTRIGLNVPPGFVITTEACLAYLDDAQRRLPDGVMDEVRAHMRALEQKTGKKFGGSDDPLLVSVRSGSAMSMPGMMDTILNLGLNETTLAALIRRTGNERFGYDAWRRFIQLFGKVALGVPDAAFDEQFEAVKTRVGVKQDVMLGPDDLRDIGERFLQRRAAAHRPPVPGRPVRAARDRHQGGVQLVDGQARHRLPPRVQDHARHGERHGGQRRDHGVRQHGQRQRHRRGLHPQPGHRREPDVRRVPDERAGRGRGGGHPHARSRSPTSSNEMPAIFTQLVDLRNRLERHYREVQDFEFTIERGTLYCLQTRNGKMNAAVDGAHLGGDARGRPAHARSRRSLRVNPAHLEQMLFPRLDPKHKAPAARDRPAGLARRGQRPGGVRRRPRRDARQAGRQGHPGARGDQARGHPRLLRLAGHPHQPRRQDLARGGGGARHGQALRRRRRGHPRRRRPPATPSSATR